MTRVPSLSYRLVINALQRAGFVVLRQRGSHIRLQKRTEQKMIKIVVPAHIPIKKSTLAKILKDAGLTPAEFKKLM